MKASHKLSVLIGAPALLLGFIAVAVAQESKPQQGLRQPAADTPAAQSQPAPTNAPAAAQPQANSAARPQRQQLRHGPQAAEHQQMIQECIRDCRECAQACTSASWHAYRQARNNEHLRKVQQLAGDCQAFCNLSIQMMERNSPLMGDSCQACEAACKQCAAACEEAGAQDQQLASCAEKCKQCAAVCHRMEEFHAPTEHAHH